MVLSEYVGPSHLNKCNVHGGCVGDIVLVYGVVLGSYMEGGLAFRIIDITSYTHQFLAAKLGLETR